MLRVHWKASENIIAHCFHSRYRSLDAASSTCERSLLAEATRGNRCTCCQASLMLLTDGDSPECPSHLRPGTKTMTNVSDVESWQKYVTSTETLVLLVLPFDRVQGTGREPTLFSICTFILFFSLSFPAHQRFLLRRVLCEEMHICICVVSVRQQPIEVEC